MANIYNMTDTWTDGSTLTSIKMNVTDTSSAADSKLLDLQVGGSSKLTVGKDGAITAVSAGSVIPFYFANQTAFPSAGTYHGAVAHSHADGAMYFAHGGNWLELVNADTNGKVSVGSGAVELNSNVVNGTAVLIADDAYATITPTGRYGGNLSITAGANGAFPNHTYAWFGYVDYGNSPFVQAINYGTPRSGASTDVGSGFEVSTSGQPSGTTGTDDKVTLYVGGTSGSFYLENRSGGQIQFQITLI